MNSSVVEGSFTPLKAQGFGLIDGDPHDRVLSPSVLLTWGTIGLASLPGETFPAGSGYFIAKDLVATAKHIIDIIEEELKAAHVRLSDAVRPYVMQVHDPRFGLSWEVTSFEQSDEVDLAVLKVAPVLSDEAFEADFDVFWRSFEPPAHRSSALELGEHLTLKGFTKCEPWQEYDQRGSGGLESIRMAPFGQLGFGYVEELLPVGIGPWRYPTVHVGGISATGQMSGGPVLDQSGYIVGLVSRSVEGSDLTSIVDWPTMIVQALFPVCEQFGYGIHLSGRVHAVVSRVGSRAQP